MGNSSITGRRSKPPALEFARAQKESCRLKAVIFGPAGCGKTYTALMLASALADRVGVMDSEHGSSAKYADRWAFDVASMPDHHPATYVAGINQLAELGYGAGVVDSLTHAWSGKSGCLELVDRAAALNSFTKWKDVTPLHQALIDTILAAPIHIIATMRTKMAYVLEENDRGKKVPRRVGLAPVQRDGMEYEFDLVLEMDVHNRARVLKSRFPDHIQQHSIIECPDEEWCMSVRAAVEDGVSWRVGFEVALAEVSATYPDAEALCAKFKRPMPDMLDPAARRQLVQYLATPEGLDFLSRPIPEADPDPRADVSENPGPGGDLVSQVVFDDGDDERPLEGDDPAGGLL